MMLVDIQGKMGLFIFGRSKMNQKVALCSLLSLRRSLRKGGGG